MRIFFFLALSLALSALDCIAESRRITLGYITDLSGKGAFLGQQSRFGAELAVSELRASGKNINVVFGDHRLDTKTALSEAAKLIDLDRVEALMCDHTPTSVAVSPLAHRASLLFLYKAPAASILKNNPYAFRNFLDYAEGCRRIAQHWRSQGIERVAHLKINFEFGELCLNGAQEIYPSQLVAGYNSGDDLRPVITSWKNRGVQAILQTAYETDMLNRLRAFSELHFLPAAGVPEPLMTNLVLTEGQAATDGTITFGFPQLSPSFLKKVEEREPGHTLNNIESAAIAYMEVKALSAVLERCRTKDIECRLRELKAAPADDTLGFEGWPDRVARYDYRLKVWRNGAGNIIP